MKHAEIMTELFRQRKQHEEQYKNRVNVEAIDSFLEPLFDGDQKYSLEWIMSPARVGKVPYWDRAFCLEMCFMLNLKENNGARVDFEQSNQLMANYIKYDMFRHTYEYWKGILLGYAYALKQTVAGLKIYTPCNPEWFQQTFMLGAYTLIKLPEHLDESVVKLPEHLIKSVSNAILDDAHWRSLLDKAIKDLIEEFTYHDHFAEILVHILSKTHDCVETCLGGMIHERFRARLFAAQSSGSQVRILKNHFLATEKASRPWFRAMLDEFDKKNKEKTFTTHESESDKKPQPDKVHYIMHENAGPKTPVRGDTRTI